jgi:hypothetical protein
MNEPICQVCRNEDHCLFWRRYLTGKFYVCAKCVAVRRGFFCKSHIDASGVVCDDCRKKQEVK